MKERSVAATRQPYYRARAFYSCAFILFTARCHWTRGPDVFSAPYQPVSFISCSIFRMTDCLIAWSILPSAYDADTLQYTFRDTTSGSNCVNTPSRSIPYSCASGHRYLFKGKSQQRSHIHLYVLYPLSACSTVQYCITTRTLKYIQIPWVQDGLLPPLPIVTIRSLRPSILLPAVLHATQLSRAHHIELPRRSEARLSNLLTRAPNATSTVVIEGGDSYYIDISLGGQNFSLMIDMGSYALYICLASSVFGVIRLFISGLWVTGTVQYPVPTTRVLLCLAF